MDELWGRLFTAHGLTRFLSPPETRRCRTVCRPWWRLAFDAVTPAELWLHDLGAVRRGAAWKELLLGGITLHAKTPQDNYESLCQTPSPYDSVIKRDVSRTLPQEEHFREKGGKGQMALFRLLRALAIRLWDIGYCQSLNFVVATLIGVFPDDEAAVFHCALALLLRHSLVDLYRPRFTKLGIVVWQFDRIVEGFLPKVHAALQRHGVNAEYYALQWFLTVFASDLPQPTVRRIWDRFLVAGWQVVVQIGLALLYSVQDELPELDMCHALSFLKRFSRTRTYEANELLQSADTFLVSHRMLSALEAAYSWEGEVQLFVAKDLNSGQVHWSVQSAPVSSPSGNRRGSDSEDGEGFADGEEAPMPVPRAFTRNSVQGGPAGRGIGGPGSTMPGPPPPEGSGAEGAAPPSGTVLPFLIHNLDTGETTVMDKAWSQYTRENRARARAKVGPKANATSAPVASRRKESSSSGSFWMQSVQRQAARRLSS